MMAPTRDGGKNGFIVRMLRRARDGLTASLFAQGYVLVANQIVSAALGLVYWAAAAHLYGPSEIGRASSTISGITLLAMVAELGMKAAFTRYTAEVGRSFRSFIIVCYGMNVIAGVLVWAVLSQAGLITYLVPDVDMDRFIILAIIVCSTLFYVQDGVLVAWRKTWIVLAENVLYNIAKLALLFSLAEAGFGDPIVASWFAPIPFFLIAVSMIVFNRSLHEKAVESHARKNEADYREVASVVGYDYVGGLVNEAAIRLLPLIVFNTLGGAAAAFFFQGWLIANTIRLASGSLTTSFIVVTASSPQNLARDGRSALIHLLLLVTATVLGLVLTAPFVLSILGKAYVENSVVILRLLALSSIPMAVNIWFVAYARLKGQGRSIMINYGIQGVATIALTLLLAPHFGISGVGIACILGQAAAVLQATGAVREVLTVRPIGPSDVTDASQMLRQIDWRFLTESPWPARAACADPKIKKALKRSGAEVLPLGHPGANCELAFTSDVSVATLAAASLSLTVDGSLFCKSSFVPVALARRRLHNAGFELQGIYIGIPSILRPRFFLSIPPHRQMIGFLLARVSGPGLWRHHLFLRPLSWSLGVMCWMGVLPEVGFVATRGASSGPITGAPFRYHALGSGDLMATPGQQAMSAVCAFRWGKEQDWPLTVVKRSRTRQGDALLAQRAVILKRLAEIRLEPVADVPRLEFLQWVKGSLHLGESFIPGREFMPKQTEEFVEFANRMTEFAIYLGKETFAPAALRKNSPLLPLDRLEGKDIIEPKVADIFRKRLVSMEGLPCVFAHNDLTPWNVLVNGSRIGIIDWGEADETGIPGVDLVYMLFHLALRSMKVKGPQNMIATYRSLLEAQSDHGKVIQDCLGRYVEALGIDADMLPSIRILTWLYHAESELTLVEEESGLAAVCKLKSDSAMLGLVHVELSFTSNDISS